MWGFWGEFIHPAGVLFFAPKLEKRFPERVAPGWSNLQLSVAGVSIFVTETSKGRGCALVGSWG